MIEKTSYVYMITCVLTNAVYIGKSINPTKRFKAHLAESKRSNFLPLYNAIRKYGFDTFELTILQECVSENEAYDAERSWILKLRDEGKTLYNRCAGGKGNFSPTLDTREKMSEAQKGKIISDEQRVKIANALKGRKIPKDVVEKIAIKLRGRKYTDESLLNFKEGAKKRSKNPHWIEKNRLAWQENIKLTQTPESRAKISAANRKYTDEQALLLKDAYSKGKKISELVIEFSVSTGTFYRMLLRANEISAPNDQVNFRKMNLLQ